MGKVEAIGMSRVEAIGKGGSYWDNLPNFRSFIVFPVL